MTGFDHAYAGTPPWDIGRPQPALEALARTGHLGGHVLDAGCGTGEHALMAAALGLPVTGVDGSPAAIDKARTKAGDRRLDVEFVVGDVRELERLGETFDAVLDSGCFHTLDDADRLAYIDSLREVVPPGGRYFMLCFSDRQPGVMGPRRISQDEIRDAFLDGWRVDAIDAAVLVTNLEDRDIRAWLASITRVATD
jgi:SAM-dependent methyltransferase